jgi:S-DNA-T family DNA segregation ATPase FtsK/SpoIIIE
VTRLHGPFVTDEEVEQVASFLRDQGEPQYLDDVTEGGDEDDAGGGGGGEGGLSSGDDLYDQAVAVVTRDRKASTSYIQRRLQIGYNRAASLIERMEQEGVVSPANHAGKRDILAGPPPPI